MTLLEILSMPDFEVAARYNEWSENTYCAGWVVGGEKEFIEYLINGKIPEHEDRTLTSYQLESIEKIRGLVTKRLYKGQDPLP